MLTLRLIRREARIAWPVAAVLALLAVLLTAVPLSWPPRFDRLAADTLADRVDRAQTAGPALSAGAATIPMPWLPPPPPGTLDGDLDRIGDGLRAAAGPRLAADLGTPWARVTTGLASVRGPGVATFYGGDPPKVNLVYAQHDGPDGPVEYLQGRAPRQPAADLDLSVRPEKPAPVEVAASEATREKFKLTLGQQVSLGGYEWTAEAVLVGVFRTDHGAQRLWQRSPFLVAPWPVLVMGATGGTKWELDGQLLTSAGGIELLAREASGFDVTWELPVAVDRSGPGATPAGIAAARDALAGWRATPEDRLCEALRSDPCLVAGQDVHALTVSDRLTPELDAFSAQRLRTEQLQGFALAGLLAVVVATAFAAARLGARRRAGAFALQRSRGAGTAGIAGRLLAESAVAVGAGVAAGWALGRALAPPGAALGSPVPVLIAALLVWCAPAVVLLTSTGRSRPVPRSRRLVLEALVLLLAVGGLAALRTRGAYASSGIDPQLALAPVLLALVVVGVLLRLLPPLLRLATRGARRSRGLVPLMALARAGQQSGAAALALLVLVLAMGYGVYGGLVPRTVEDAQVRLADWRTGGAPVALVGTKERLAGDLSKVPTVGHQVAVTGATGEIVAQSDGTAFERIPLVGLDATALAAARPSSPVARALAAAPGADAPVGGSDQAPVLTALATPALTARFPDGDFELSTLGLPRSRVRVIGALPEEALRDPVLGPVLGDARRTGPLLVFTGPSAQRLPAQKSRSAVLFYPAAGGPAVDPAAVRAAAVTQLAPSAAAGPQSELRDRAGELDALRSDGLARSVGLAFRVTTLLGLLLGLGAFALDLLLSATERARTTSYLRTLGTGGRAVFALQVLQLLPLLVLAALGGGTFGLLLAPVLGSGLRLGAVTGGPFEPATHIDWTVTAGLGLALTVLMTAAAVLEAAISRRRGLGAVLRLGEAL
ncbi:hypothetical protein [Kitasatospora sp. NPDC008115]|uniref:hypothetical protein n=1 Tax=Kitasatospora sp. NPDC008115 TaxID=3364022 RepID=UPI0036E7913B